MYPPKGFDEKQLTHVVNVYEKYKTEVLSPEKRFRNKSGLNQSTNDVFTYFQEGHVQYFLMNCSPSNLTLSI
ncbi:hypothetical protein D3C85_1788040 [compost metagenome]